MTAPGRPFGLQNEARLILRAARKGNDMADLGAGRAFGGLADDLRKRIAKRLDESRQRIGGKVDQLMKTIDDGEQAVVRAIDEEAEAFNEQITDLLGNTANLTEDAIADAQRLEADRQRLARNGSN